MSDAKVARSVGRVALAMALGVIPVAVACSSANDEPAAAVEAAPIINGSRETGRPAVVSLLMERPSPGDAGSTYSSCTGTIVKVNAATKMAYVLTAAHCVRGSRTIYVSQTDDTSAPATGIIRYTYVDHTAHPNYNGATSSPYDIAVVRVLGGSSRTPILPWTTNDGLVEGSSRVTSVGFGRTVRPNMPLPDSGPNTEKNKIDGTVARLGQAQVGVRYDNNGDICQGDSGGPVLAMIGGRETVVAVHSFVTGPCVGVGWSVRASAHAAFINSILDAAAPEETCEQCRKGISAGDQTCADARRKCFDDAQCNGLRLCLGNCSAIVTDAGGDAGAGDECRKQCNVDFPFGAGPYNQQVVFCSCRECGATCGTDPKCEGLPKCGMKVSNPTCNSCLEGSCCAQTAACAADGHCFRCRLSPDTTEGCDTDPLYQAVKTCRETNCAADCAQPDAGADAGTTNENEEERESGDAGEP